MASALFACAVAGFISGFFVVKLRVNSFIATLGMSQVITAFVYFTSEPDDQRRVQQGLPEHRHVTQVFGLPLFCYYLARSWRSSCGTCSSTRRSAATCSPPAATPKRRASPACAPTAWCGGRSSRRASIAGFAGIIYSWKVGNYAPTVGPGYLFPAIAAVFFGASQLKGRPNVWGTFIALLRPRLGHQGAAAHVHLERALDRAAVPGRVAARRGVAGQPPG